MAMRDFDSDRERRVEQLWRWRKKQEEVIDTQFVLLPIEEQRRTLKKYHARRARHLPMEVVEKVLGIKISDYPEPEASFERRFGDHCDERAAERAGTYVRVVCRRSRRPLR